MIENADPAMVASAKRYAALSAIYDPADALPPALRKDPTQATLVASALAIASDTNPDKGSGWLMRSSERRYVLREMRDAGELPDAVARRRRLPTNQATEDLLDALAGEGAFATESVAAALTDPAVEARTMERLVTALDRADEAAPAAGLLVQARLRLAAVNEDARRREVQERGFFGRNEERATLSAWTAAPTVEPPVRAALVTGTPGIGKSALLDAVAAKAVADRNDLVIRLDFDRAGLDVLDLRGLTMEVARQLVERIGASASGLLDARVAAAGTAGSGTRFEGSSRAAMPAELADAIGAAVARTGRGVLFVLDTMEVLRARGDSNVAQLFDWLDRLVDDGLRPLAVIAASRGDVLDASPDRRGVVLPLPGLDEGSANALLGRLAVPGDLRSDIVDLADGCPLVLRLAAQVIEAHGGMPTSGRIKGEVTAGFLYRFLLSRIADPELRRLAHPGLVARRLSAEVLREVIAPQVGLRGLSETRARILFDALASQHWLVERDPIDPLFVRHRGDMRALLLPMLYRDRPAQCAGIDAAASRWFGRRRDVASQVDSAYHALQLMRRRPRTPMISPAIARLFDTDTMEELPESARKVVERVRGGRTSMLRGGRDEGLDDGEAASILERLTEAGDWREGRHVVDRILDDGLDPNGLAADAVRTFHWRAGLWQQARRLLAEHDRAGPGDDDVGVRPPNLALARYEMRAEFAGRATPRSLSEDGVQRVARAAGRDAGLHRKGALGLVLAASGRRPDDHLDKDGDPVMAALALNAGSGGSELEFTLSRARERLRSRGVVAERDESESLLLATMSPYGVVAANLAQQPELVGLTERAHDVVQRLSAARRKRRDATGPVEGNAIAAITDLGLLAEFLGVAAWESGNSDLRRLARSAERWRRTMAGEWSHGARPIGWRQSRPIDRTLRDRLDDLMNAPTHVALEEMAIWSSQGDGERVWDLLRLRFAGTIERAAGARNPSLRAAQLRRTLPAAFVPAATLLTSP